MWYKMRNQDEGRGLNRVVRAGALRGGCADSRAAHARVGLCHQLAHVPRVRGVRDNGGLSWGSPGMRGMGLARWAEERDIMDSPSHTVSLCAHRSACHLRGCVGQCESHPGKHRVCPGGEVGRRL